MPCCPESTSEDKASRHSVMDGGAVRAAIDARLIASAARQLTQGAAAILLLVLVGHALLRAVSDPTVTVEAQGCCVLILLFTMEKLSMHSPARGWSDAALLLRDGPPALATALRRAALRLLGAAALPRGALALIGVRAHERSCRRPGPQPTFPSRGHLHPNKKGFGDSMVRPPRVASPPSSPTVARAFTVSVGPSLETAPATPPPARNPANGVSPPSRSLRKVSAVPSDAAPPPPSPPSPRPHPSRSSPSRLLGAASRLSGSPGSRTPVQSPAAELAHEHAEARVALVARMQPPAAAATLARHKDAAISHDVSAASPAAAADRPNRSAQSLRERLDTALALSVKYRWLEAGVELAVIDGFLKRNAQLPEAVALQKELRSDSEVSAALHTIRCRYKECTSALGHLTSSAEWTFAEEADGAVTRFRHDEAGRLWFKIDGLVETALLECLAMWKEVDLASSWFPFCERSDALQRQSWGESVATFRFSAGNGFPLGKREALLHHYLVDALDEGFLLLMYRSAQTQDYPGLRLPRLGGLFSERVQLHGMQVMLQPLSTRTTRCSYLFCMDLQTPFVPRPLLNWAVRCNVGRIFASLQREARRISDGPLHSHHAARMEAQSVIYFEWALPRVHKALQHLNLRL